jgi:hypothetical protein
MPFCETTHEEYLLNEGLPKLVRSTLRRKFSNSLGQQEIARSFLKKFTQLTSEKLNREYDVIENIRLSIRNITFRFDCRECTQLFQKY